MSFPPEVYSRCLLGDYGYPLWTPQLNRELCESYQLEGLKIGDVGILSPNNGSFDVLFNITIPRGEQPYPELVGGDFAPVTLSRGRDLNTETNALPAEYVFPRGSVRLIPTGVRVHDRDQKPSRAHYEFSLSAEDGAVLILPEGADKCDLKNERMFLDEAIRHGVGWYECATDPNKAGRLINNDSLYLVTGFHKARSWSLGATDLNNSTLQNHFLTFEVEQLPRDGTTAQAYHWAVIQGFMGRVGPLSPYNIPNYITDERRSGANQTVFVRGFRITVNRLLLIFKTASVETSQGTFGGAGAYVNNLLWGKPSESTVGGDITDNEVNQDFQGNNSRLYADTRMTIDRVPDTSQVRTFHPGDFINRYLLKKEPRAILALTHDRLWVEMLQLGLLELADFSREERLEEVLSSNYQIIAEDGKLCAVYFQNRHGFESASFDKSEPAPPYSVLTRDIHAHSVSSSEPHPGNASQDLLPSSGSVTQSDNKHPIPLSHPLPISPEPTLQPPATTIDDTARDFRKHDQFENAEQLLTTKITTSRYPDPHHIDVGDTLLHAMTFSTNGKFIVGGDDKGVRVWRVRDGNNMVSMKAGRVDSLAVSNDGKWIAAGTYSDGVFVWNAEKYERVDNMEGKAIDFSPDSSRLVQGSYRKAIIWDLGTWKPQHILRHKGTVRAAKFAPEGNRIATGVVDCVFVWDSNRGDLLVEIKVEDLLAHNRSFVWSSDHIFVVCKGIAIREFDTSSGSLVTEWPISVRSNGNSNLHNIMLPKHGAYIVFSIGCAISIWDMTTHRRLALTEHTQNICSIALSPDDRVLAISGRDGKISFHNLSRIIRSIPLPVPHPEFTHPEPAIQVDDAMTSPLSHLRSSDGDSLELLDPTLQGPSILIDNSVLDFWKHNQFENADQVLTTEITTSLIKTPDQKFHASVLASRSLVRSHRRLWDEALQDAKEAIKIQPSVIGFIAKSVAHVGKGERDNAYRNCDIALKCFHSSHVSFLLLIKAIVVFTAGEHLDAISRMDDLITTIDYNDVCYTVQFLKAYMHLVVGNSKVKKNDLEGAIQSFERARSQIRDYTGPPLSAISLIFGWRFDNLSLLISQRFCEALYAAGRISDAVKHFHEFETQAGGDDEYLEWSLDFKQRSCKSLEQLGDIAVNSQRYNDAISYYSMALPLVPHSPQAILVKRGNAQLAIGSWKEALDDAVQVISFDSSSPTGYQMKHAAFHKGGEYDNAIDAYETMLSKMAESHDPDVQQQADQYVQPGNIRAVISNVVQWMLRGSPRVLINTTTGCLHDRTEQLTAFESLPVAKELVSSMTTRIDRARIKHEVRKYFRYVMLSHTWEDNEPLFQDVKRVVVYGLETSLTHDKLKTFCKIARDAGFHWAWSDTCCIDKSDNFVLQEALAAMFEWYQNSAMVIVFLRNVYVSSPPGALAASVWNTRAWTLQEYIAAKVVRFYTEDWDLYMHLDVPNHKESPKIIAEMEQATGISAQRLMELRPGLTSIREKLRLASTRETTMVEDAAYSLLGIFSAVGIPIIYGEGEASLGRLLANVITRSGDASILAWTGEHSPFNSCLPARISVFDGPASSHLPSLIPDSEMQHIISGLRASSFDIDAALRLYDRLNELPVPRFATYLMALPCIAFHLPRFSSRIQSGRVYCADTIFFGMLEIRTKHDLSQMTSLYLAHPWLDTLIDHGDIHGSTFVEEDSSSPSNSDNEGFSDEVIEGERVDEDSSPPWVSEHPSMPPHADRETGALRLVARLRQPFGALLLSAVSGRRDGTVYYKRVAADALITVRFQENVSLSEILDNVRILDVL